MDLEDSSVFVKLSDESKMDELYDKLRELGYPSVNDENSVFSKAKSIVSCVSGRLN